ncbi:MAG: hypothetical protein GX975_04975 [Clostridiales bacterium]|nr:hypothetical protein [Clostridiales bacterium]
MKKLLSILLASILIFSLGACGNGDNQISDPTPPPDDPEIPEEQLLTMTAEEWPIVDGATAFLPYYTAVASKILGVSEPEASDYVLCSTTDFAYPDLINKKADIIFCLLPSEDQVKYAQEMDVTLVCTPIINEAFVFFVNRSNPVDELSIEQLRDIYAGRITNWKEVGGDDLPIIAYQRSEGSGSQTGLYLHVVPQDEVMIPPLEKRIGTMGEIVDAVAGYDNAEGAIGYSYLYFITNQHYDEQIKVLKINGIEASKDNVASGRYPMISQACAVYRAGDEENAAGLIAAWCAGPQGQKLAEEKGYVPNKTK